MDCVSAAVRAAYDGYLRGEGRDNKEQEDNMVNATKGQAQNISDNKAE